VTKQEDLIVKTATKLFSAAFALAAIASVALPTAQPAAAASPADLEVKISKIFSSGPSYIVDYNVKNVGGTTSGAFVANKSCAYLNQSSVLQWIALPQGPVGTIAHAGVEPGKFSETTPVFTCPSDQGRIAVAARVDIVSGGDANLANNRAQQITFELK
jgi:hypothetical protein